jgi:hypothetical protein
MLARLALLSALAAGACSPAPETAAAPGPRQCWRFGDGDKFYPIPCPRDRDEAAAPEKADGYEI